MLFDISMQYFNLSVDGRNILVTYYGHVGDNFADGNLPTIDVKIWVKNGIIELFSKPMSANTVLNAKTALGEQTKFE